MARLTNAQLADALAETQRLLLAEREARNADVRRVNVQLADVARQRDEYRSRVDSTGVATAINYARARQLEAEDRATEWRERQRVAEEKAHDLADRIDDLEHALHIASLEQRVAVLDLENANLRHHNRERDLRARLDTQTGIIRDLKQRVANPDLALTLENGQTLLVAHDTYGGRWQLEGFHLLLPGGRLRLNIARVAG